MPNGQLAYEFTENLYEKDGITAGELSGVAYIDYTRDGEWEVDSICLLGYSKDVRSPLVDVPVGSEIYNILHARLTTGDTSDTIQYYVSAEAREDRMPDPDYERERRRDDAAFFGDLT